MVSPSIQSDADKIGITGTPFAVIPRWVRKAAISANAVRLYVTLNDYVSGMVGDAWPSRKTLQGECHFGSIDTLDKALRELETIGAVKVTRQGFGVNTYHVFVQQQDAEVIERRSNHPEDYKHSGGRGSRVDTATPGVAEPVRLPSRVDTATRPSEYGPNKNQQLRTKYQEPNNPGSASRKGFFDDDPEVLAEHQGIRSKVCTQVLNDSAGTDGKQLTPRERKQLRPQVEEWLAVGYESAAISEAIRDSPYKTPNAVGGQLRKQAKQAVPQSWGAIGSVYQKALLEEEDEEV